MKHTRLLALVPALALFAADPALARQEGGGTAQDEQDQRPTLRPMTFVKASIGSTAFVKNEEGRRLGVVRDHVIGRQSGKVVHVAVGPVDEEQGPAHLVPYDRFSWDAEKQLLSLPLSADELAELPVFDPENLPPVGVSDLAGKDGEKKGEGEAQEAAAAKMRASLASSVVLGSKIMAAREPFATVRELILEPKLGSIEFVLARSRGAEGDPHIIPWRAMNWRPTAPPAEGEEEERGRFVLTLTKDALGRGAEARARRCRATTAARGRPRDLRLLQAEPAARPREARQEGRGQVAHTQTLPPLGAATPLSAGGGPSSSVRPQSVQRCTRRSRARRCSAKRR